MSKFSRKLETCCICNETNESVVDTLCEPCEPLWLKHIQRLSKELSQGVSLKYLFDEAAKAAKVEKERTFQPKEDVD